MRVRLTRDKISLELATATTVSPVLGMLKPISSESSRNLLHAALSAGDATHQDHCEAQIVCSGSTRNQTTISVRQDARKRLESVRGPQEGKNDPRTLAQSGVV